MEEHGVDDDCFFGYVERNDDLYLDDEDSDDDNDMVEQPSGDATVEDVLAGIEMLTISAAEGIEYVGQSASAARFNASALEGNVFDSDSIGRFDEEDSDSERQAQEQRNMVIDDENVVRGLMGDEFDGQYEWMVSEDPNDIQRNFMGNDTLHRIDMKRMGLEIDGDPEEDAESVDDDGGAMIEDEDDEYDGEDNNNPLLGNAMFIETINGRVRMHEDLALCCDLLTNLVQRVLQCQSESEIASLIKPEAHFFLCTKYDSWDRFYVRNFKSGLILSKVDAKTELSPAMLMYSELAKLHFLMYYLDHIAVRSRVSSANDSYGTNNTINSGVPVWMRILGPKSQWTTEELLFCRELFKRAPLCLDGRVTCSDQFRELPHELFLDRKNAL